MQSDLSSSSVRASFKLHTTVCSPRTALCRDRYANHLLHQHLVYAVHAVRLQDFRHVGILALHTLIRMSSRISYDRFGNTYNVTQIINPDTTLNVEQYTAYSPLFLSATFAMAYGLSFASITATLTHTFLYFRKTIWVQSRRSMSEQPDIHARLMSKYRQVPEWWYLIIFRRCTHRNLLRSY